MRGSEATSDSGRTPWGGELPLVGRRADLAALRLALDDAIDGRGRTVVLTGEAGVGKTRLLSALVDQARGRDVTVAVGRASSVESGLPYGVIGDALLPALRGIDSGTLSVLTRGVGADLRTILPGLADTRSANEPASSGDPDRKARLLWNFAQFLCRLAARSPMLLVVENGQWFDPSSTELLHFLARQISEARILVVVSYTADDGTDGGALRAAERSLAARGDASVKRLLPLTLGDTSELLRRTLGGDPAALERAASALHRRTLGNPFFIEETLKAMLAADSVRRVDDRWVGWDIDDGSLPTTVREALHERYLALPEPAQRVAAVAAVIGTRAPLFLLEGVAGLEAAQFLDAVDVLCARRVFVESANGHGPQYDFAHPLVQATVLGALSAARARALHGAVANAMERLYGDGALSHASSIATHLVRAQALGGDARSVRYLIAAGRSALERQASREAAEWLGQALAIIDGGDGAPELPASDLRALLEDLALAKQRIGGTGSARLWERAYTIAADHGDDVARSRILRRMGLAAAWAGHPTAAMRRFEESEEAARQAGRGDLAVRVRVAKGMIFQSLGQVDEGKRVLEEALPEARALGQPALIARVHRGLSQLYAWTGPSDVARAHAREALAAAEASGDRGVAWSANWAMAVIEGLTGNSAGVESFRREAQRLADELHSPMLQALTAEIAIEYASAVGNWTEGLALAERTIPVARAIARRTLLPRLLVWTGLIILARDDEARAKQLFDEAWELSGAGTSSVTDGAGPEHAIVLSDVHNVILAHTGMAAYHVALGEYQLGLELGLRGLALADRFGFAVWAIHRLLPLVAEASIWIQDWDRVEGVVRRLRHDSLALGHPLAMAWAAAAEALVFRLRDQSPTAAASMVRAAEELDAVPFVFHAARLRRNAAQLLEADGNADEALRILRLAHDVFDRVGAERELRGTRSQMRSLGVRLPPRHAQAGAGALTGRELEIARLVARRLTNKEIARELDISARTVSTHLSNMFEKLHVDSRAALADVLRDHPELAPPD
jgi:DNA-binding CsgD family transcriptional regulator